MSPEQNRRESLPARLLSRASQLLNRLSERRKEKASINVTSGTYRFFLDFAQNGGTFLVNPDTHQYFAIIPAACQGDTCVDVAYDTDHTRHNPGSGRGSWLNVHIQPDDTLPVNVKANSYLERDDGKGNKYRANRRDILETLELVRRFLSDEDFRMKCIDPTRS